MTQEYFLASGIRLSRPTFTKLKWVVAGMNNVLDKMDTPISTDKLAEEILSNWIAQHHPQLEEIATQMEALSKHAVESIGKPPTTKP